MKNKFHQIGDTTYIEITTRYRGKFVAMIDTEDLPIVFGYRNWRLMPGGRSGRFYVGACAWEDNLKAVCLHRLVMKAPEGTEVKIVNGNGLDCRKSNLLVSDHAGVMAGRKGKKRTSSGHRNIYIMGKSIWVQMKYKNEYFARRCEDLDSAVVLRDKMRALIDAEIRRESKEIVKKHQAKEADNGKV